ncbi:hypothetical protein BLNAU_16001 [Blattamonas nauphoetae]|uniref:Protein kinase domain-containing protein n=1 Tax=Blattamonas nauphoetae TaxID=2049346 RepID=A0ABQ9XAX1_9EUKA|nr:hypothetical protein BLNAU_16001 [Blattamonas nauphoetae]
MLVIPLLISCLISRSSLPGVLPSLTDSVFSTSNAETIDGRVVRFLPLKAYESNTLLLHSMTISIHGLYVTPSRIVEGESPRGSLIDVVNSTTTLSHLCFHPTEIRSVRVGISSFVEIIESEVWIPSTDSPLECNTGFLHVEHSSFALMNPTQTTPSLATSMSSESSVVFSSCSFSDLGVSDDGPLFCSTNVSNVTLLNLKMSNISTTHSSLANHISNRAGNVSIVGSSVTDSEDALTGGLVPGMSLATSFFVANTTISKCFTNAVDITENNPSMTQETLSASHIFINCTWTSTTTSAHGGAIRLNNIGDLTVDSCKFLHCNTTTEQYSIGGAICFVSEEDSPFAFSLNSSLFDTCYSARYSGSVYVNRSSNFFMKFTNFSKSSVGRARLTAHLMYLPAGSILSNLRFEYATAEYAESNSGAIDFDTILADITHSNILFNSNTAGKGGALLYSYTSGKPDISWFSCIFFNNVATMLLPIADDPGNTCLSGGDLYFFMDTADWNATLAKEGSFRNCFSNSDFPRIVINTRSVGTHNTIRFQTNNTFFSDLFPTPSLIVSVRDDANDEAGCGMNYFLPCKTLGYAGQNQLSTSTGEVLVEAGLFEEMMGFVVDAKSATVTSYGNENPVFDLSSVEETFVTISNGFNANLKYLSFIVAGHPVLQHTGTGKVSMESCLFVGSGNEETVTPGLISISTGALTVINTNFSSLKVGSGGLLKWDAAESVTLTNLFFLNLETTHSAPFTITPTATLSLSGLYFERCVGASFSDFGVDSSEFSQISTIDSWLSTSTSPRTPLKDGEQLTLWPSYQMVVDGNEGVDEAFCWLTSKKCRTLSNLVTRLGSNFKGTIAVTKGRTSEAGIVVANTQKLTVTGESRTESIFDLESSETSLIIVPSASSLSLSSLTLTLPSSQTSSPVISSTGTLTLSSVTITLSSSHSDLSADILSVTSGTASLVSCSFDGEHNSIGSFLSQNGGIVTFEACSMSRMRMKKSFVSGSGIVLMKGCSFSSLVDDCSSGSGNVIEMGIGEGEKLEIMKTATHSSSFISCSSKGNGGALKIAVVSSGTLTISDTSFVSCSATGNGGAMWLDVTEMSSPTQLSFSSASFGTGTTANTCTGNGMNVFVRVNATDATTTLKPSQFPSSLTTPENSGFFSSAQFKLEVVELLSPSSPSEITPYLYIIFPYLAGQLDVNSVNGVDHTRCGHSSLPCKTLPIGHQNLKGTGMAVQLKENDGITTVFDSTVDWMLKSDATRRTLTVSNAASFNVKQNSLTLSSLTVQGSSLASSLFVLTGGSLVLTTCSLTSLTTTSTSSPITGTISSGHKLVISTDTSFTSCSSENGGVVNVKIVGTGMATLSGSFDGCHATSKGGAVFVDMTQISTGTVSFVGAKFGSTTANTAPVGTNLYLVSAALKTDANTAGISALKPLLPTDRLFTENEKNQFVGFETDSLKGSLLLFWFSHSSGPVHINLLGQDHLHCGDLALACRTLEESFVRIKTTRELSLDSSIDMGVGLSPLSSSLTIKSTSTTTNTLALTSSNSFKVTSGTLTFTNIILTLAAGTTDGVFEVDGGSIVMESSLQLTRLGTDILTSSLFTTKSGLMRLDGSALNLGAQVMLSSQPLFAQNGGRLEIVGLTLTNVVRTIGDGSVISSTLSSGSLSIASCSFSSCVCSSGNGGVMKVVLTGTGTFTVTGTTTFSSCSASGDGKLIHLSCSDLVSFLGGSSATGPLDAIRPNTTSGVAFTSDVHEEFWGMDTNAVSPSSGSLLFYWYPHTTGSVRVASSGTDHPNCGLVELPCSSLSHSMNVMKTTKSVVMQSDLLLATSLTSIDTTWSLSRSGAEKLTLSGNGGILVDQPTTHLTLSSLEMKCGTMTVDRTSALICVTNGKVSMADCSVGDASGEIPIPFCTISTGTVELTGTNTILNPSVSSPLFTVASGSLLIDGNSTSFTTITSSSTVRSTSLFALNGCSSTVNFASLPILGIGTGHDLFAVSGTATLNLNKITLDGGDASVESLLGQNGGTVTFEACSMSRMRMKKSFVSGSGTVLMKGCSFSSLVDDCSSGSGNVIEMGIGEGEKLEIMKTATHSSSFISCSSKGNGGALKIAVVSSGTLTISDTLFVSCSATGNGGGIWLDLSLSTAPTPFAFSGITFGTNPTKNTASKGRNIYALAKAGSTSVLLPLSAFVPSTPAQIVFDQTERTMVEFGEVSMNLETEIGSLLYLLHPSGNDVRVRASVGFDHSLCGASVLPCSSLQTSYTNAHSRNDNSASVVLDSDLDFAETITAQSKAITITKASQNTLTFGSSAQLNVVSDTLTLTSLKLGLPSSITTTPFVVSGGSLIIESSADISHSGTDSTPTTLTCPLMSITSGSLSMKGTTTTPRALSFFSNSASTDCCLIKIESAQNEAPTLTLSSCHFTDCSMTHGAVMMFGGASSGSVDLEECYFTRNEGSASNDVFATKPWAAAFSNETVINCFSDSDMNHLVIGSIPLNDFIPYSILGVNGAIVDDAQCDLPGFSCSSVRLSLGHCDQKENETHFALRLIQIEDDVIETDTLNVGSRRVVIFGSSETVSLTWNSDDSLLTLSDGSASLESFTLTVQSHSSQSSPVLVLSSTGTLSLTSIHFEGENSVFTQSLINAKTGSLQISSSSFRNIEMSGHALIETSCVVDIEECSFSEISREGENATILSAHISQATPPSISSSVSMRKTSFENCMPTESQRWVELIGRNSETFSSSGWTGTFNKTSIWGGIVVDDVLMEIEDDLKPFSLIYEFFRRTDPTLIVSSVSGNVDHPLCGHSQLPCHSIDEGRKLTSVQTMEIVSIGEIGGVLDVGNETVRLSGHNGHGTVRIMNEGQIVSNDEADPGQLIISKLDIDVSSSTLKEKSTILMETGSLELSSCSIISTQIVSVPIISSSGSNVALTKLTLSSIVFAATPLVFTHLSSAQLEAIHMDNCTVSELISISNIPSLSISQSDFVGISPSTKKDNSDSCEWSTGLISISDCKSASVVSSRFTALSQGALLISNSNVTVATSSFSLNTPTSAPSEQVRRNIRCENSSTVEIESLNGGDGVQTTSHWISADESCAVTKETKKLSPALFIPTLTTKSSNSVFDKKKGSFNVTLTGSELIPCGLFLEIYELNTENDPKTKEITLTKDKTTKLTQTVIILSVSQSELGLNNTLEWRGRLLYEDGLRTDSFLVKMSAANERKSLAKQVMRWLGPLIGGLVALFFLLLIIVLLVRRHRKKKETKQQTATELNTVDEMILKDDGFNQTDLLDYHSTFSLDNPKTAIPISDITDYTHLPPENNNKDSAKVQKDEIVAAVSFGDCVTTTPMNKQQSLYSRLHGQNKIEFDKLKVRMILARGVERLASLNPQAAELANLSPHTIFIDTAGNQFFQATTTTNDLGAFFGSCPTSLVEQSKVGHENQRWQAPEVRPTNQQLDREKAAVFSLGLLLWEIETEEIPMKELDAANAQRVLGAGMQLDMEHIHPDEYSDLIIRCIHRTPSERPTAADTVKLLEEIEKNKNKQEVPVPPNPVNLHNL